MDKKDLNIPFNSISIIKNWCVALVCKVMIQPCTTGVLSHGKINYTVQEDIYF